LGVVANGGWWVGVGVKGHEQGALYLCHFANGSMALFCFVFYLCENKKAHWENSR